jgi:hypothetical protein
VFPSLLNVETSGQRPASLVGVPLISFAASQFPEVSSFLFSWLEPGMAALKQR